MPTDISSHYIGKNISTKRVNSDREINDITEDYKFQEGTTFYDVTEGNINKQKSMTLWTNMAPAKSNGPIQFDLMTYTGSMPGPARPGTELSVLIHF